MRVNLEAALAELRQRVDELQSLSSYFASLAFEPVTGAEIREFEDFHGVTLPDAHRRWLEAFGRQPIVPTLVGGRVLSLADCTRDQVFSCFSGALADGFRYHGSEPVDVAWDDEQDDYVDPEPLQGTLCLGSAGCDEIYVLVVSGPERGSVWGFVPGRLHPTGMTAAEWSLGRITRRLDELRRASSR